MPRMHSSSGLDANDQRQISLAYLPPTPRQTRFALVGGAVLLIGLAALAPFAGKPLSQANGFIPALDAIIFVTDLITASLFLVHFSINRSRALLVLAWGYLFSALMVAAHVLSFPEAFSKPEDIARAVRINFMIYLIWHLGLPAALFAYVWLRGKERTTPGPRTSAALVATSSVAGILALVGCVVWLVAAADKLFPPPRNVFQPFPGMVSPRLVDLAILICAAALFVLWTFRRSVLDQWLMVVVLASMVELAITGHLGWHNLEHSHGFESRFTLGFYAGRSIFSLLTSTAVLVALLAETNKFYAGVARANSLASAVAASQALSSEIELPKLIERLMSIALAAAGADGGLLILPSGDGYQVRAEARATGDLAEVAMRQKPVAAADLPQSAVQNAIRTRELVLLDDASADDAYSKDEYVRRKRLRSVLCLPIVKQAQLVGLLYLENNLAPFVFTPDRVAVLQLLASQAAISLENSALYTNLQRNEAFLAQGQKISHTGSFGRNVLSEKLYWSEETYRIYELDRSIEPTLGWLIQRIHPEDRVRVQQTIENAIHQREGFDIEYRLMRRDNSVKYLHVVIQALENASGELEFAGAVTDITERKQAEEALRQAQADLARISRVTTMGELAASLAHEIKQPITGAIINVNTCLRKLGREEPDLGEVRAAVSRIGRDTQRAVEIIDRIRSQFEKGALNQKTLDVNAVVRETVALLRSEAVRCNISVRMELAAGLPQIVGDSVQLQQVVMNLIVNSIEAMKDVDGTREMIVVSRLAQDAQILVSITDTGIGLLPELAEKIFDPFFTTKPHGTGMGLRISRSIVESHGGRLWAVGSAGRGATFHLSVPAATQDHESTQPLA
jgi:signal transduction histidine kinase